MEPYPNPSAKARSPEALRFGVFDLNLHTGELRKKGVKVRIQDQPFQILALLLQRPGELVSREELVKYLWPEGTFVDYDHGLNTAVNKLRETLGDSADSPRFIETLPRRGYRFIGEVAVASVRENGRLPAPLAESAVAELSVLTPEPALPTLPSPPAHTAMTAHLTTPAHATTEDELPMVSRAFVRSLFLLSQLMYAGFYIAALAKMDRVQDLLLPVSSGYAGVVVAIALATAMAGIPVRFFLLTAVGFDYKRFREKYDRIFYLVFALDELWGLAPLLMAPRIGFGLTLAAVAALLYLPFGQRTLVHMAYRR